MEWIDKADLVGVKGDINLKTSLNRLNYYGFCRSPATFSLENLLFSPYKSLFYEVEKAWEIAAFCSSILLT